MGHGRRLRPQAIEAQWQDRWGEQGTYEVDNDDPRPPLLRALHVPVPERAGAHGPRAQLHLRRPDRPLPHDERATPCCRPIGFDSFGLPAENAAIKTGVHPRVFTDARIEELPRASTAHRRRSTTGAGEVTSHDPEYIRWTQWIFLRFLEAGLAYRKQAPVNWCPGCQTVLANEQVLADGTCERCGDLVEKRDLEQWFFKITDYAEELLDDLDALDWPEQVKTMQRNWIGRSEGAEFDHGGRRRRRRRRRRRPVRVFTTRPDTSFGMTFAVLAPEHPLVASDHHRRAARRRSTRSSTGSAHESEIDRLSTEGPLDKRGVFTGAYALNPFTGQPVPIYLADYVLIAYGTGAIMAVPGQDQRDWDFATGYGLPIIRTVEPPAGWDGEAYTGDGPPSTASGSTASQQGRGHRGRAIEWLEQQGIGERKVNFRLRDWLLSPPALLGLPDPDRLLPRPRVGPRARRPAAGAGSRRRRVPARRASRRCATTRASCTRPARSCGGPAERETDTMDTFVDSSWYFLRFCDPWNDDAPFAPGRGAHVDAGRPVHRRRRARHPPPAVRPLLHQGAGRPGHGAEGAARAVHPPVHPGHDPPRRRQDVQVEGQPGRARGHPRRRGRRRPAPGPPVRRARPPTTSTGRAVGIEGCARFLRPAVAAGRPARSAAPVVDRGRRRRPTSRSMRATHRLIARVTDEFERWSYNTAVAAFMEFTNELYRYVQADEGARPRRSTSPSTPCCCCWRRMTPHITAELWERRHRAGTHVHAQPWPVADPAMLPRSTR